MSTSREAYWRANPELVHRPILAGRLAAEAGSFLLATRIVPLIHRFAPERYEAIKGKVAERLVLPHLAWYESHLLTLPAFSAIAPQVAAAADDRARSGLIASALVDFAAMTSGAVIGQGVTQAAANRLAGLPALHDPGLTGLAAHWSEIKHLGKPVLFDKAVNMSLVGVMQFGVPRQTEALTEKTSDILQKTLGLPPEATRYLLQWQLPNLAGFGASSWLMTQKYREMLAPQGAAVAARA